MTVRFLPGILAAGAFALLGAVAVPTPAVADVEAPDEVAGFAITSPAADSLQTTTFTLSGIRDAAAEVQVDSVTGGDPYCVIPAGTETWACEVALPNGRWPLQAVQVPDAGEPTTATVTIRMMGAPDIDGADPLLSSGLITGSGFPGAGITIIGSGPQNPSGPCAVVAPTGFWSCPLPVGVSGAYSIAAQHTWPGTGEAAGISDSRAVTLDKDAPGLPAIASPARGQRVPPGAVTFSGTGEPGARVEVFLNGSIVCSSAVSGGTWACTASVAEGTWDVQAIQWDAAGNPSGATAALGFSAVRDAQVQPPRAPAPPPPAPEPAPAPEPSATADALPPRPPGVPFFPPPVGGVSGLPPLETWDTPTDYGAAIPVAGATPWWLGVLLGVGYLALVAIPLRLLAGALRGRLPARIAPRDEPPLLRPWVTAAAALGGAVVLAALAGGVQGEVRYLRLAVAIGIALATLNLVGVLLASRVAGRAMILGVGLRLAPVMLAIGAVAALLSRIGGVQPPVIVGVVVAATVAASASARGRGVVALTQLATITALGLGAWLVHSALGPVVGLWQSLASETLAALCIAALGSAAVLLVPIGRMPGREVWDWSRPAWLAAALPPAILAGAVFGASPSFPVLWVTAAALVLATVSVSVFVWLRHVEPMLAAREQA